MEIGKIVNLIEGRVLCGQGMLDEHQYYAFASDLMSDVLTVKSNDFILITGLMNVQVIRTAEMSDIKCIIMVRDKKPSDDVIRLAVENDIMLITTRFSMFKTSGILYSAGISPIY